MEHVAQFLKSYVASQPEHGFNLIIFIMLHVWHYVGNEGVI